MPWVSAHALPFLTVVAVFFIAGANQVGADRFSLRVHGGPARGDSPYYVLATVLKSHKSMNEYEHNNSVYFSIAIHRCFLNNLARYRCGSLFLFRSD